MLQPWRERILTALLVVVIAVPVGIVIGGGLDFGGPDEGVLETTANADVTTTTASTAPTTTTPPAPPAPSTTTTPAVAARPPSEVSVRFSNGSRTAGAAVTVGNRLRGVGYDVLAPGASPGDPVPATVIQYREGFAAEAAAIATALGVAADSPVAMPTPPTFAGIGNADVFVVVGEEIVRL